VGGHHRGRRRRELDRRVLNTVKKKPNNCKGGKKSQIAKQTLDHGPAANRWKKVQFRGGSAKGMFTKSSASCKACQKKNLQIPKVRGLKVLERLVEVEGPL